MRLHEIIPLAERQDPCWKGYVQRGTKKKHGKTVPNCVKDDVDEANAAPDNQSEKDAGDPCWKGYHAVGMKTKNGKKVPNCVPDKP